MYTNKDLITAMVEKNDEFYTLYKDIEAEMNVYLNENPDFFRNKIVYCPCDDPTISNFTKYFVDNFNKFGLKKFICTCCSEERPIYKKNQMQIFDSLPDTKYHGKVFILDSEHKNSNSDIEFEYLKGNGDFRSDEVQPYWQEADFITTNPPFSLFKDFIQWIFKYHKKFSIIGNHNAITLKCMQSLLKHNEVWFGNSIHSHGLNFEFSNSYELKSATEIAIQDNNTKTICIKGTRWFTNVDYADRYKDLELTEHYTPEKYPKYDDTDIINVDRISDIPCDYDRIMGVPISFFDYYNPNQFEIFGTSRLYDKDGHTKDINKINGNETYKRLLIKRKH